MYFLFFVTRTFLCFFYLVLMFVILALGLSEANAPYPIFIYFFNKSFNFMCCTGDLLAVAGILLISVVRVSPY